MIFLTFKDVKFDTWEETFAALRDIFANMSREQAESAIIVIDEFDKLCEPKYGSGGNNYSAAMQNELLKMIEGNKVFFPEDKGKVAMEFDTSKISFVFCGSFETLITRKREINSSIGFGKSIDKSDISVEYKNKIKTEDLMTYAGVRREICGRINQVVQLRPMTAEDYKQILQHYSMSPVRKLEKEYHIRLKLNREMQDILAKEADFFSIGTNDLTGYTMAADRGNPDVAYLYSAYNPAVLRSIRNIISAANKEDIMAGMCGEAASDPLLVPVLLGFGLNEFSVSATAILATRKVMSLWTMDECKALVDEVMQLETEAEVKALLEERARS